MLPKEGEDSAGSHPSSSSYRLLENPDIAGYRKIIDFVVLRLSEEGAPQRLLELELSNDEIAEITLGNFLTGAFFGEFARQLPSRNKTCLNSRQKPKHG